MCMVCKVGTPTDLPFLYCKECVAKLDNLDPSMNIPLLKMLVSEDHREVLVEVGYDKYAKLLEVSE